VKASSLLTSYLCEVDTDFVSWGLFFCPDSTLQSLVSPPLLAWTCESDACGPLYSLSGHLSFFSCDSNALNHTRTPQPSVSSFERSPSANVFLSYPLFDCCPPAPPQSQAVRSVCRKSSSPIQGPSITGWRIPPREPSVPSLTSFQHLVWTILKGKVSTNLFSERSPSVSPLF